MGLLFRRLKNTPIKYSILKISKVASLNHYVGQSVLLSGKQTLSVSINAIYFPYPPTEIMRDIS